jgi:AbrB family looped-hinge helix DNA binding protein
MWKRGTSTARRGVAARVDDKGRLVIPRAIREAMGLQAGDAVYCRSRGGVMHCVKAQNPFDALAEEALREHKRGETKSLRAYARERAARPDAS